MNQQFLNGKLQNVGDTIAVKAYAEDLLPESTASTVRTDNPAATIFDFAQPKAHATTTLAGIPPEISGLETKSLCFRTTAKNLSQIVCNP